MSEKDLIKENNRMRKKLDPHNLKVYEDMLVYIRLNYKTKALETEEILNELLSHILQAQRDGKNIESVTGEDYKGYADNIIDTLPKRNIWRYAGILAVILVGFNLIFDYLTDFIFVTIDDASAVTTINLIQFLLHIVTVAAIGVGFIFLIFYVLQYILFKNWPVWKEYGLYFLTGAGVFFIYLITSYITGLVDTGPSFEVGMWIPISLGIILTVSGFIAILRPLSLKNNA